MAMIARIFRNHGTLCAEYPCEVIVATFTLTALLMTSTTYVQQSPDITEVRDDFLGKDSIFGGDQERNKEQQKQDAAVVTILTILRVLAVLYSCYQFRHLYCKLKDSKHVLVIAGLLTVFSSLIFTTTVLNYLWLDVGELKDALFFFLLLTDLGKTALLAEFALSAGSRAEVRERIGGGMAVLGPSITLDTAVETLVIGVGTLSGVYRLEMLSYIACLSVAVNYIIFMTFYPACLSLITELSKKKLICDRNKKDETTTKISHVLLEEDQKSNPVVQRVKLIMSVGLTLVHIHSWWPSKEDNNFSFVKFLLKSEETTIQSQMLKYMTLSADHLVILILLLALIAKFLFYEKFYEFGHLDSKNIPSTNNSKSVQTVSNISPIKSIDNVPQQKLVYNKLVQTENNLQHQQEISKNIFFPKDFKLLSDEMFTSQDFIDDVFEKEPRSIRECLEVFNSDGSMNELLDEEVVTLVNNGKLNAYQLETVMEDLERAVRLRRRIIGEKGSLLTLNDMDESRYVKKKVKALSSGNDSLILSAAIDLAAYYSREQQYNEAIQEYQKAAEIYKDMKNQLDYAKMCRMIGDQYVNANKFGKALNFYQIYVKISEKENNLIEQQRAYASMGHMYLTCYLTYSDTENKANDKDKLNLWLGNAKKMFIISLKKSEKITDISKRDIMEMSVRLFINLAVVAEYMGNMDEAVELLQRSIEKSQENDIFDQLERAYSLIGALYAKQNNFGKAIAQYNLAIKVAARLDDKVTLMSMSLETKADMFLKLKDFQTAKSALLKSYKLKKRNNLDLKSISRNLKVVVSICNTEDLLITANAEDHATRKRLFEKIADGACILKQFPIAIEYYHKMHESAIKNSDLGEDLNPCYISLAHTYLDIKDYQHSIKYFRLELENVYNMEDRLTTYFNIADATEKSGDVEAAETIFLDALNECGEQDSLKLQILKRWLDLLKKSKGVNKKDSIQNVTSKLKDLGSNLDLEDLSQQESLEANSEDIAENITENIGDDIDLDELTDDSNDSDVEADTTKARRVTSKPRGLTVKKNAKGETQLHIACIKGSASLVKGLLQQGHPVNVRDYCGWQPLHEASLAGHLEVVKLLLDKGASINDRGGTQCNGMTPLHDAASNGHLAIVEYLLDKGASAIIKTDDGQTCFAILKTWHSSVQLNSVEQTYYADILQRLTTAMNKAGLKPDEENINKRNVALIVNSDDSDNSMSSVSAKDMEESGPSEYKKVMSMLRSKEIEEESIPKKRKSDENRKSALLSKEEVGDDWLDDDLIPNRRKPKGLDKFVKQTLYGDRVMKLDEDSSFRKSRSNDLDDVIKPGFRKSTSREFNDEVKNQEGSFRKSKSREINEDASPVISNRPTSTKVTTSGRLSLKSQSSTYLESSKIKRKKYMIQPKMSSFLEQNVYEDSSSNDCPEVIEDFQEKPVLRVSPQQSQPNVSELSQTVQQPLFHSVDVTIESRIFKIPIAQDSLHQTNIGWLKQEAIRRYIKMNEERRPSIDLVTISGAYLDDSDLLAVLFPTRETVLVELCARIHEWNEITLVDRYKDQCAEQKIDTIPRVVKELQNYSGTIDLSYKYKQGMTYDEVRENNIDWDKHTGPAMKPFVNILKYCSNLTHLHMSRFPLKQDVQASLLVVLPSLPNLSLLDVSSTNITDDFLIRLSNLIQSGRGLTLTSLCRLNLSYNDFTNQSMESLRIITSYLKLQELHLSYTKFTPGTFSDVLYLTLDLMECLDISMNRLEKWELLKFVSFCRPEYLRRLNLADSEIGEEIGLVAETVHFFRRMRNLEHLQELNFSNCNSTDMDVSELVEFLPMAQNLEQLNLSYNKEITGRSLQLIFDNLPNLPKLLDLSGCEKLASNFDVNFTWTAFASDRRICDCIQLGTFDFKRDQEICDKIKQQWKEFRGGNASYLQIIDYLEMNIEGREFQAYKNSLKL